jgi:hypothetical protein
MPPLRALPVFALAVLVTLGLFGFIGVVHAPPEGGPSGHAPPEGGHG